MGKKRNKKYCALKHSQIINEHMLKNLCVVYISDGEPDREIMLCDLKGNKKQVARSMAYAIEKMRYKWSIMISVFGKEKNGKNRCEHQLITIDIPLFQSDMVEFLNDIHQEMIKEFKKHNIAYGAAWVASAIDRNWSEDEVNEIYIKNGAWSE